MKTIQPAAAIAWLAVAVMATASPAAVAQNPSQKPIRMNTANIPAFVSRWIATTHREVSRRTVSVDGESAELTRYERRDGRNAALEGEHFSTVMAADGTLKGFANIALDLVGKPLPSRERTEQIARAFLQENAPDLLPKMEIHWIEPHDEPIKLSSGSDSKTVTLTGMKLKARNLADGRWFWVIVGSDEKPMVFERDIVWISFPGHRKTEKWLHDGWLKKQAKAAAGGKK
ncbi:MAG: hypothetical protein LBP52_10040 [Burkholderiaceae bacterium]|nr:hypothetical protein [Burkholderiaceae bacterium]